MNEATTPTLAKKRISDRSKQENLRMKLAELDAKIAGYHKRSDIAATKGDLNTARMHRQCAEIHAHTRPIVVKDIEEAVVEAKIALSLPALPEYSAPEGIPYSQMTENQRHALEMNATAQKLRNQIDREGVEGKYSVELDLMHTFLKWRDEAIKKELGWKLHGGTYYPPLFSKKTPGDRRSWLHRLFG